MNDITEENNDEKLILPERKPMEFDELLPHVGEYGIYQVYLFFMTMPFLAFIAFIFMSQMFITLVPDDHYCHIPGMEHTNLSSNQIKDIFIPKDDKNRFSKCTRYNISKSDLVNITLNKDYHDTRMQIIDCDNGWTYNRTEVPYNSFGIEFNWVCDKSYYPNLAVSVFYVGAIFGGFLLGFIADHYGRVSALVAANIIALMGGVCTIFTKDFWTFVLCRFLVGLAYDNCFTMFYIILLEYTGVKWRTFVANMSIAIFFAIAMCSIPWIAIWTNDWKIFTLATSVPMAFAFFVPFLIPESARWLLSQGRIDDCVRIMKQIAKINRRNVNESIYQEFLETNEKHSKNNISSFENKSNHTLLDLFKTPRMRMITILLCIMWMTTSIVFDGHARNAGSIGSNIFIVHTIGSSTEFPADTLLVLILDKVGRRWPCAISLILGGIFSLLTTIVPYGVPSATLAILGRATANFSYNIGVQYAAELLPTVVRGQGIAFIHVMGYIASMMAPLIVYMSNVSLLLPMIILGILGVFGGLCCLWLPESLGSELPQTIDDGENIGLNQKFFSISSNTP